VAFRYVAVQHVKPGRCAYGGAIPVSIAMDGSDFIAVSACISSITGGLSNIDRGRDDNITDFPMADPFSFVESSSDVTGHLSNEIGGMDYSALESLEEGVSHWASSALEQPGHNINNQQVGFQAQWHQEESNGTHDDQSDLDQDMLDPALEQSLQREPCVDRAETAGLNADNICYGMVGTHLPPLTRLKA
jgi:hypothetical protein